MATKSTINQGKKMGVWKNGKLIFQSRDKDAIYNLAEKVMVEKPTVNVWVATVGSFVTV